MREINSNPAPSAIPSSYRHSRRTRHDFDFDWLAFAHLIIAVFFIGPILDPVRNVWVLRAGVFACLAVVPLAFICGEIRGIPLAFRLVDCTFGVGGFLTLLYGLRLTKSLESRGRPGGDGNKSLGGEPELDSLPPCPTTQHPNPSGTASVR